MDVSAEMPGMDVALIRHAELSLFCARRPTGESPEHAHAQLQLTVLFEPAECSVSWPVEGRREIQHLKGPALLLVAPHQLHTCLWTKSADIAVIFLEPTLCRRLLPHGSPAVVVAPPLVAHDLILWQFAFALRRLCLARNASETHTVPVVAESVAARAVELLEHTQNDPARSLPLSALEKIEEFVRTQLGYDIHVDDLARCAGYSIRHFSLLFKNATGVTPADYIFERRMLRAQELLRTREFNIREVAERVGYADPGHFTGKFRRHFGFSPRMVINDAKAESPNRPTLSAVRP